jgi:hypothetical protein
MKCVCIKCEKHLPNIAEIGLQPSGGLAFLTHGHCGSAYFDPMTSEYLEISVCDSCVRDAEWSGAVYRGNAARLSSPRKKSR